MLKFLHNEETDFAHRNLKSLMSNVQLLAYSLEKGWGEVNNYLFLNDAKQFKIAVFVKPGYYISKLWIIWRLLKACF